ncbi:MAG TPA: fibronectin type III domain-containing protein [bacterium]|nr:fibronectin type III domain-containing protein [bacterium]
MRNKGGRLLLMVLLALLCPAAPGPGVAKKSDCPYKVYVILGFHTNMYHSWRGDTNDEAGFGQDIRIVRAILQMLDQANQKGLDARGYWEGESLFTFEDIVPKNAPDITADIKRRIDAGLDEFMPAPYSNTLFSAVTADEMRAVVRWSVSNPWGSGAQDLFGSYVPLIRPQESMLSTGSEPILLSEGFKGVTVAYSGYAFTSFSNFVPALPPEQRFHFTWMRTLEDGPRMILFPCVSAADVVNYVSLEKWMLDLHQLQTSGQVNQDLVIHINFDADADTWLPLVPKGLRWIPNSNGLDEYINAVNKYPWAEFTLPSKYLAAHEPVGEVLIRQDLADGGWDGNYSWAEKYPSHIIWTELEKSRLFTYQAQALMRGQPEELVSEANALLFDGRDSSFFQRLRGLSTTHYGMSTPIINEERQAVAEKVVGEAKGCAEKAERMLADRIAAAEKPAKPEVLYSFLVRDVRTDMDPEQGSARSLVRVPVILPDPMPALAMSDASGADVPCSLVSIERLANGKAAAELMIVLDLKPGESRRLLLKERRAVTTAPEGAQALPVRMDRLGNGSIDLALDPAAGVSSLKYNGEEIAGKEFLAPFITYGAPKKPATYRASDWTIADLSGERWQGVTRSRISASIPFPTPHGEAAARIEVTFTLPDAAPWLVADVAVDYPYTVKEDVLNNIQQKLRRYLDLKWIEVAPFQMHPLFSATREDPIKVWKHNYLDVTSWYELNYGQINPGNASLDSFNHQVTAGWVAVTDKKRGLLIGENSAILSSYAFCPMRLQEQGGQQQLWLNPFGSYYGRQMDYSHLGGTGLGAEIAETASSSLRPNGPSYNGMKERFSLLLAPYTGDEPPEPLRADARAFFYPAAVVYLKTPEGVPARLSDDVNKLIAEAKREEARKSTGPLPMPLAFLANPTVSAVDLVWDMPDDARIDGYEIEYPYYEGDDSILVASQVYGNASRHRIEGLQNGKAYTFRMRATSMENHLASDWTQLQTCTVGPVKPAGILSNASGMSLKTVMKFLYAIDVHLLTTP